MQWYRNKRDKAIERKRKSERVRDRYMVERRRSVKRERKKERKRGGGGGEREREAERRECNPKQKK